MGGESGDGNDSHDSKTHQRNHGRSPRALLELNIFY
jgi:hypothetical protein